MTTVLSQPISKTPESTVLETDRNRHEVHCGMCGKVTYVQEDTFAFVSDAIKAGLDAPFRCERCKDEYDDLAYEG